MLYFIFDSLKNPTNTQCIILVKAMHDAAGAKDKAIANDLLLKGSFHVNLSVLIVA